MFRILPVILITFIAFSVQAEAPVPLISGPTESQIGDIIVLDASGSAGDHFSWLVDSSSVQVPKSRTKADADKLIQQLRGLGIKVDQPADSGSVPTHLILDDGKRVILASYPGEWRAVLAVSSADGVKQLAWGVKVNRGDSPVPPAEPVPPVTNPPVTVPEFGLKVSVAEWKTAVPVASRNQSVAVAGVIQAVSTEAIAGKFAAVTDVETALFNRLSAEMTAGRVSKADWAGFGSKLMDAVAALKALGSVTTATEFGHALAEVVEGLK